MTSEQESNNKSPGEPEAETGSGDVTEAESSEPSPGAIAEEALDAAQEAIDDLSESTKVDGASAFTFDDIQSDICEEVRDGLSLLSDVNLNVTIELGRTKMLVEDVIKLAEGAVVELDKLAGDPVDIFVNDRIVARGEVLVLNENFCVRISEILAPTTLGDSSSDNPSRKATSDAKEVAAA